MQVYEVIRNRYLAVFCSEDCLMEETEVTVRCGDHTFKLKGTHLLQEVYLKYELGMRKDKLLSALQEGKKLSQHFQPAEKETDPPKKYNTASLNSYLTSVITIPLNRKARRSWGILRN